MRDDVWLVRDETLTLTNRIVWDGEAEWSPPDLHNVSQVPLPFVYVGGYGVSVGVERTYTPLVTALPVNTSGSEWKLVLRHALEGVQAGEVITAYGEIQVQNELDYNINIVTDLRVGPNSSSRSGDDTLADAQGVNVSPRGEGNRKDLRLRIGSWRFDEEPGETTYIKYYAHAKGSNASAGDEVEVKYNFGKIEVVRMQPD